jgi:hypothetical protein
MAKEEVLIDVLIDTAQSAKNLDEVAKSTRELTKAKRDLDFTTDEGAKKIALLNQQINKNNAIIKENADALTKQRLNIGNYASAIDKLIPGFDGLSQAVSGSKTFIDGATKSIGGMSTGMKVMLGPIGLAIAAFGLLASWFSRTEAGGDLLAKTFDQIQAIMGVVLDRAAALGGALTKLFTGDFIGAANDAKRAVSGVGDEIAREASEAGKLAEILDLLEDRERDYSVAASETELAIKALIVQAKNRNLTEQQKIDLLQQATELEINSNKELLLIRQDDLDAAIRKIRLTEEGAKIEQGVFESQLEFAKRLVASQDIQGDKRQELASKIIAYNQAEGQSLVIREKIANQVEAQELKARDAEEKRIKERLESEAKLREEVAKRVDLEIQAQVKEDIKAGKEAERLNKAIEDSAALIAVNQYLNDEKAASDAAYEALKAQEIEKAKNAEIKAAEDVANRLKMLYQARFQIVSGLFGSISALIGKNTAEGKAAAIAEIGVNTAEGISRATAAGAKVPYPGNILAIISGIAAVLGGIAQAKSVLGFERGGVLKLNNGGFLNGPSHANGGIPFSVGGRVGFEAEGGEAIINKRSTAMFRPMLSAINRAGGGVAFEDGGVLGFPSSTISGATNSFFDLSRLEQTISNLKVQVAVTDINDGQKNYAEITDRAQF